MASVASSKSLLGTALSMCSSFSRIWELQIVKVWSDSCLLHKFFPYHICVHESVQRYCTKVPSNLRRWDAASQHRHRSRDMNALINLRVRAKPNQLTCCHATNEVCDTIQEERDEEGGQKCWPVAWNGHPFRAPNFHIRKKSTYHNACARCVRSSCSCVL